MKLRTPQPHRAGRTWLRVMLFLVGVALAINLVIQMRKVWQRVTDKKTVAASNEAGETTAPTNTPPPLTNTSFNVAPPPPAMAMVPAEPDAPPQPLIHPTTSTAPARPSPPASTGGGGGGTPAGFGRMGFSPGTVPVVLYQPGTLTFVAIPFDDDDLTNGVAGSTNQIPRLSPPE